MVPNRIPWPALSCCTAYACTDVVLLVFVLQALGVEIDLGPEGVAACVREAGVGFMYAPRYHPAMAAVRPVRAALKVSDSAHSSRLQTTRRTKDRSNATAGKMGIIVTWAALLSRI
jgi:hypothetical protein